MDYSNSQIITLRTGDAKIQTGHFKIIHDIDLRHYETATNDIETDVQKHIPKNYSLLPYLQFEIDQARDMLHNLKPKSKRSLDFIGTAWKWIAGSPDHEDFATIKEKVNNVLINNNKQMVINSLHNNRINNITRMINQIKNFVEINDKFKYELILNLEYKLKLIKEDLVNIKYAIHWAKKWNDKSSNSK